MKKYLKILPLILYPYAYLLFLFFVYSVGRLVKEEATAGVEIFSELGLIAVVLYNLWVLILSLWSAIGGLKRYTPTEAAKMNFVVKGWQIPAYIFHFLLGAFGALANVWGIGFVVFSIIIDLVTIFLSGLFAVGCVRRLKKEGVLSSETAFLAGFGSFIYCVDVVAAIALVRLCKKKFPQEESKLFHGTERSVRIRKTLAYLSALLMALYPYAHMYRFLDNDPSVFVFGAVIYTLLVLFIAIRSAYDAFSLHSSFAAAGMNLAVKGLQVPAYIINFFSGALMGSVMSVWGLIPIVFFVVIDVLMIALSGIYSIGCMRRLKKEGILSSGAAILAGISSFIFVVDVIVAIVLTVLCYAKSPKKPVSPRSSGRFRRALDYLPAAALIFYPYAHQIPFPYLTSNFSLFMMCALLYTVLVFIIAIYEAADTFSQYAPRTAAKMTLAVKVLQIPAWFLNASMGVLAAAADALVFTVPLFLVNGISSLCSGIYAVGCVRRLKKEGILSSGKATLAGIGSFIFGVDVIVSIVLVCLCHKKGTKAEQNETIASPQQTTVTMLPPPQASAPAPDETQNETDSTNNVNVPPQEQQTAAENPLPPPLPPAPQKPAPVPNETQSKTASTNAVNVPQPKKRRKASEMPLPPPLPPAPQKPTPDQNEAAEETAREE